MPWYQVAAIVFTGLAAAITVSRFAVAGFVRAVESVMERQVADLGRAFDELDAQNAHRFASIDNVLGDIQAQFQPNGGASHRDRLEELHRKVEAMAACLEAKGA